MADLIDREALKRHLGYVNTGSGGWASVHDSAIQAFRVFVDGEKAVDAVPVVRCKDCKFYNHCKESIAFKVAPDPDWFCADAERKDGV